MWFLKIRYFFIRVINKLCKLIGITVPYYTRYGLKTFNKRVIVGELSGESVLLDPESLYLGFDCLKDEYTHLDKPISCSPHYELMEACESGDPYRSEYNRLALEGALDGRDVIVYKKDHYERRYEEASSHINDMKSNPIVFYMLDGKRYIFDGKHRSALALKKGLQVWGKELPYKSLPIEYLKVVQAGMRKRPSDYGRNLDHVNALIGLYDKSSSGQ